MPLRFRVVCYVALLWQPATGVDVYVSSLAVEAGAEGSAGVCTKQEKNS